MVTTMEARNEVLAKLIMEDLRGQFTCLDHGCHYRLEWAYTVGQAHYGISLVCEEHRLVCHLPVGLWRRACDEVVALKSWLYRWILQDLRAQGSGRVEKPAGEATPLPNRRKEAPW